MLKFIEVADAISAWFGKAFAWCILIMALGVGYEVFVRYVLRNPTSWAFDLSYMMYGALFMMAGAYALARDSHVRADFLYRLWPAKVQASVEFVLYFLFFFPGVLALIIAGWKYASRSWTYQEVSVMSPANVPIFQFKTVIVAAGILLLIQGIAQVLRCVVCMRTGAWPEHAEDVEELDTILLMERERGVEAPPGTEPPLEDRHHL
jgi:TRAP-type mannitol/chloroaromatic compound transport system permease small subunit